MQVKKNTELQRQMEALDLQKEEAVSKEREVVESSAIELELVKNVSVGSDSIKFIGEYIS